MNVFYAKTFKSCFVLFFFFICLQLKYIFIKCSHHFPFSTSAPVCASKLFVEPQKFPGCLRLIKPFWEEFFTYCNNFGHKAQMVFYLIKQDQFSTHELTGLEAILSAVMTSCSVFGWISPGISSHRFTSYVKIH